MTLSDLSTRCFERLNDQSGSGWYSQAEVTAALNWAQRLFVLMTLCIEKTISPEFPNDQFIHMRSLEWGDWFLPLRVRYSNEVEPSHFQGTPTLYGGQLQPTPGPKIRPTTISRMDARDAAWVGTVGLPKFYAHLGTDLLIFDRQFPGTNYPIVNITYAASPVDLVNATDIPGIPDADQPCLADAAVPLLRMKEGGQEFAKAQRLWQRFLDVAQSRAAQIRARNRAQQYDALPPELSRADLSRIPEATK